MSTQMFFAFSFLCPLNSTFTAKNANVSFCGVKWGFRGEAELRAAGAEFVAGSVEELITMIESL